MKFQPQQYKIPDERLKSFIDTDEISDLLGSGHPDPERVREVLQNALGKNRLTLEETSVLVNTTQPELIEEIKAAARKLKKEVYGDRIVLFAPLYVGNHCVNNCKYCGFRASNKKAQRKTLSREYLIENVEALEENGQKRLILVYGEHPSYTPDYIADTVRTVYQVKKGNGEIRRVNINAAPLDIEGFRKVRMPVLAPTRSSRKLIMQILIKSITPADSKRIIIFV